MKRVFSCGSIILLLWGCSSETKVEHPIEPDTGSGGSSSAGASSGTGGDSSSGSSTVSGGGDSGTTGTGGGASSAEGGSGGSAGTGGDSSMGGSGGSAGTGGDPSMGGSGGSAGGDAGGGGDSGSGGTSGSGGATGSGGGSGSGSGGAGGSGSGGTSQGGAGGSAGTGGSGGQGSGGGAGEGPMDEDPCQALIEGEDLSCSTLGDVTYDADATLEAGCHSFGDLSISAGAVTVHTAPDSGPTTIIADTVDIGVDGLLSASRQGYAAGNGPGRGENGNLYGGGAGHGGRGGDKNLLSGGDAYGDAMYPITAGSGGGIGAPGSGGDGGGAIRICAREWINVAGRIATRGGNTGPGGAGAGGSILLIAPEIGGDGRLIAAGGTADALTCSVTGGSGAGGRVALRTSDDQYEGTIEIQQGGGCHPAENGSSYRGALP